jgi:hypothetical protein
MDFATFAAGVWAMAESYKAFQESGVFEEWVLSGVRVEGSIGAILGLDINADVIWDWNSFDGDVFVTFGWQGVLPGGYGINAGPLLTKGMSELDDYTRISDHAGFTLSSDIVEALVSAEAAGALAVFSLEPDYGWSSARSDGSRVQSFFLGVLGTGEELSAWRGTSIQTWSIKSFLEKFVH